MNIEIKYGNIDTMDLIEALRFQNYIPVCELIERISCYKTIKIINENEVVGYILLELPNPEDEFYSLMKGYAKAIIVMHSVHRGKGLAKEAIKNFLNDKILLEGVNTIEAMIADNNYASINLCTSFNFKKGYRKDGHTCYTYKVV